MPLLTTSQYPLDRDWLRTLWLSHRVPFGDLLPRAQWQLHEYFQPTLKLEVDELLGCRAVISKIYRALPQQAGRALVQLKVAADLKAAADAAPKVPTPIGAARPLQTKAVVHPNLDGERVARAFTRPLQQIDERDDPREALIFSDVRGVVRVVGLGLGNTEACVTISPVSLMLSTATGGAFLAVRSSWKRWMPRSRGRCGSD